MFMSNLLTGSTKKMTKIAVHVMSSVWEVVQVQNQNSVRLVKIFSMVPIVLQNVQYLSTMILAYVNLVTKIA